MKHFQKIFGFLLLLTLLASAPMTVMAGACSLCLCDHHDCAMECPRATGFGSTSYATSTGTTVPGTSNYVNFHSYGVFDTYTGAWEVPNGAGKAASEAAAGPSHGKFYVVSQVYNSKGQEKSGMKEVYKVGIKLHTSTRSHTHYKADISLISGSLSGSNVVHNIEGLNSSTTSKVIYTSPDTMDEVYKPKHPGSTWTHGTREYVLPITVDASKQGYVLGDIGGSGSQAGVYACNGVNLITYLFDMNSCAIMNAGPFAVQTDGAFEVGAARLALRPIQYTIKFVKGETNKGGSTSNVTAYYDENAKLSNNGFTGRSYKITFHRNSGTMPDSYDADDWQGNLEFKDWKHSSVTKDAGATVKNLATTNAAVVTWTAQWKSKTLNGFPRPTREGYTFAGWYDNASFTGEPVTSVTVSPSTTGYDQDLYAKWKPKYTTKYALGIPSTCSTNNTADGASTATREEKNKVSGTKYQYWTPNWVLHGYHYAYQKWYDYNYYSVPSGKTMSERAAFGYNGYSNEAPNTSWVFWNYAYMVPNSYTVKYDKNKPEGKFEVQGTVADQSCTFDTWFNLRSSGYTCAGYDLVGWSKIPGDYDTQLAKGAIITSKLDFRGVVPDKPVNLGLEVRNCAAWSNNNDTVTLYAVWKPIPYTVKYTKGSSGTISTTSGTDVSETAYYSKKQRFYNNTPNLSATKDTGTPHFTSDGYYVQYWRVAGITGTRVTSEDMTGYEFNTETGYKDGKSTSDYTEFKNLVTPTKHDCVVTLEAVWAPIEYKTLYKNDNTIPDQGSIDRGYSFSSNTKLTEAQDFDKSYKVIDFSCWRQNKYGPSTFLGYCFAEGDKFKQPNYVVESKSPVGYLQNTAKGYKREYTAIDWKDGSPKVDKSLVTHAKSLSNKGLTWKQYFGYLIEGEIQSFDLYAVWDDCPGMEPIDTEQLRDSTAHDYDTSTKGLGALTRSRTDLEYKLLLLSGNEKTIWDREDPVSDFTSPSSLKNRYYIDNLLLLKADENKDEVTSFELRYTLVDENGNKYQTSRLIYSGYWTDIQLHDVDKFSHY